MGDDVAWRRWTGVVEVCLSYPVALCSSAVNVFGLTATTSKNSLRVTLFPFSTFENPNRNFLVQ